MYIEWPERESNPRHADFQGVGGRPLKSHREPLDSFQQRLTTTLRVVQRQPEPLQECGVQVLIRYRESGDLAGLKGAPTRCATLSEQAD